MPRVSVVVPSYNAVRFIGAALDSILAQSSPPDETIIVDDGSTDGTRTLLAALAASSNLRVIHQANRGPGAARNAGIKAATGEFIALLDADDIALPERLRLQTEALLTAPSLAVVAGAFEWIDEAGRLLSWPYHSWRHYPDLNDLSRWLSDCPIVPSATMFRKEAWRRAGGFKEDLIGTEDWDLWMRLCLIGEQFAWNREVVCLYRRVGASLSGSPELMGKNSIRALNGIIQRPDFPAQLAPIATSALALRYADVAKRLFWRSAWVEGRDALSSALAQVPALLHGSPCRLEDELVAAAQDPLVESPISFLATALDHLPNEALALRARRDAVLLRCRGELLLRSLVRRESRPWRHLAGMQVRPALLLDRGLWNGVRRAMANRRSLGISAVLRNWMQRSRG